MKNRGIASIVILEDSLEAISATRTEEAIKSVVYVPGTTHCLSVKHFKNFQLTKDGKLSNDLVCASDVWRITIMASPAEQASNVVLTDVQEPIKVSFIMTERNLLNFVCDQKQNHTFNIQPRIFSQRPTQMRKREKPWRGMVPGNPLPWKRLEIKKDNQK